MTGITVAQPIWVYLIAVNICTFLVYGIDKQRARSGRWRIPESRLLLLAAVGGSLGAWMGMYVFHHKTRKAKFYLGIPLILVIQCALTFILERERVTPRRAGGDFLSSGYFSTGSGTEINSCYIVWSVLCYHIGIKSLLILKNRKGE